MFLPRSLVVPIFSARKRRVSQGNGSQFLFRTISLAASSFDVTAKQQTAASHSVGDRCVNSQLFLPRVAASIDPMYPLLPSFFFIPQPPLARLQTFVGGQSSGNDEIAF